MKKPVQQPAPVDPDFHLWRILDHTRFMIGRAREKELAQFGLTPEQSHVLDILVSRGGSATINEIVEITQRQHHSISTLVARMCRQGFITKKKNPADLRKWDVFIAPRGELLFRELTRDSIHRIISCLSQPERRAFKSGLLCLLKRAYEELGQPESPTYKNERSGPVE